ncbi:peroxidase family protein [Gordonia rhizosphera]|nr:peroxidase family protein [Gordonia rhizosphera]
MSSSPSTPAPKRDRRGLTSRFLASAAERIDRAIGWPTLGTPLGLAVLVGLRSQLRAFNLVDTGAHPGPPLQPGDTANHRERSIDGRFNDVVEPSMGSYGSRFGRNVPLANTYPEPPGWVVDGPNPRLISTRLLDRKQFQPATTLNLLAAAWIQFEVHDWFNHGVDRKVDPWVIERPDDDPIPSPDPITIPRTTAITGDDPDAPPAYAATASFWWDGSQIYGDCAKYADAIRTWDRGQIELDHLGLPPIHTEPLQDPEGSFANFWVGLALLHSLFLREHNAICRRLAAAYPDLTDQQLYDRARLVNCALMAKIHTVDWTPAIIAHPTTVTAMRGQWFGLLGERISRRRGRVIDNEVLCGIPGSPTDFHDVRFSLTEEFVAVYRMHPLIPDTVRFRSQTDDAGGVEHPVEDLMAAQVRDRLGESSMADLLYSFGRAHPGALTLHNFPRALQHLERKDSEPIDLATIDLLRIRERGVPRYNEFRELLRLKRVTDFDELTDNEEWAAELRRIYGHIDRVDLMIGLLAEKKPPGFGFSDTAFRIFIVMASRRLSADRFFTSDFRPEVYTEVGMAWVRDNSMRSVLLRHFPTLAPALEGVRNPFAPWNCPTQHRSTQHRSTQHRSTQHRSTQHRSTQHRSTQHRSTQHRST